MAERRTPNGRTPAPRPGARPAARGSSRPAPAPRSSGTAKKASATRAPAKKAAAKKRPATRTDRSGRRALGRVDGTADARRARGRNRRRMVGGLVVTVLLVGVLFIAVFPTRSYLSQRTATSRSEAELAQVQAERARLQRERDALLTDEAIEEQARENGMVGADEEPYRVLPEPVEPIGLPDGWPFTGVEQALGAP